MKILYGVQGTGNGHLSRARAMAKALAQYPQIEVDWLFSGRPREHYFDMEEFGHFKCCAGLTFFTQNGCIDTLRTLTNIRPIQLWKDIRELDLSAYDLVISDYEPVTAWAQRRSDTPGLGIGHQYAFNHSIPIKGSNPITRSLMKNFAPMPKGLGLHWHHFDQTILPPIVDLEHCTSNQQVENKVLVYLPFENTHHLLDLLQHFPDYHFYVYAPNVQNQRFGNCHTRGFSREGFKHDLAEASWVLCNSGFELISEALQLGKRILCKPVHGQMEQHSNGAALEQLGLARVEDHITLSSLDSWLSQSPDPVKMDYPDVASAIARWLSEGRTQSMQSFSESLWNQTNGPVYGA